VSPPLSAPVCPLAGVTLGRDRSLCVSVDGDSEDLKARYALRILPFSGSCCALLDDVPCCTALRADQSSRQIGSDTML